MNSKWPLLLLLMLLLQLLRLLLLLIIMMMTLLPLWWSCNSFMAGLMVFAFLSLFAQHNFSISYHHFFNNLFFQIIIHHIALVARISPTLSCHSSLSFNALGRSSGQHPVSSHSCWMYVHAGRPAFARPCVGVHKSTSLMSSSLLLQQCPACLVRLTWIVFVIGCRWPYSWCLVGCCRQDLEEKSSGHYFSSLKLSDMTMA